MEKRLTSRAVLIAAIILVAADEFSGGFRVACGPLGLPEFQRQRSTFSGLALSHVCRRLTSFARTFIFAAFCFSRRNY